MVPCWHQAVPNEDGSSATMVESDTSLIWINIKGRGNMSFENKNQLDPVGSTVRYEMMKLYTGSVKDTMRR